MRKRTTAGARSLLIATLCSATTLPAAAQSVLEYLDARVEIRGLKQWSTEMLIDSMRVRAPNHRLASAACAIALRQHLGFASAAVYVNSRDWDGKRTYVISVVEPRDSGRVAYAHQFSDSLPDRPDWAVIPTLWQEDFPALMQAFRDLRAGAPGPAETNPAAQALDNTRKVHGFLTERTAEDWQTAVYTLWHDRNEDNRMAAAAVLARFPERSETWHALAHALLDPHQQKVASLAVFILRHFHRHHPRRIDWTPVDPAMKALFNGAELFVYIDFLELLAATADPAWVRDVLMPGWDPTLVLHMLNSSVDRSHTAIARRFLTAIRGEDLGDEPAAWRPWLEEVTTLR